LIVLLDQLRLALSRNRTFAASTRVPFGADLREPSSINACRLDCGDRVYAADEPRHVGCVEAVRDDAMKIVRELGSAHRRRRMSHIQ
jgi:hypothetical protein